MVLLPAPAGPSMATMISLSAHSQANLGSSALVGPVLRPGREAVALAVARLGARGQCRGTVAARSASFGARVLTRRGATPGAARPDALRDNVPVRPDDPDLPVTTAPLPLRFAQVPTGDFPLELRSMSGRWNWPNAPTAGRVSELRRGVRALAVGLRQACGFARAAPAG